MCYNISYLTKKRLDYAKRLGELGDIEELERSLEDLYTKAGPTYYATGFSHPDVPVITNLQPDRIQMFTWGLIPSWIKDIKQAVDISNKTLNARGEEMFDKPSYRLSARKKRCLVIVDGFFEFHWIGQKSIPFFIQLRNSEPMLLAGLWESWEYAPEQIIRNTFSIITTRANPLMTFIHNKPKGSEGSRMPVIIPRENIEAWLNQSPVEKESEKIRGMIIPYEESLMEAYPVASLKGKYGTGNTPEAVKKTDYPELDKKRSGK